MTSRHVQEIVGLSDVPEVLRDAKFSARISARSERRPAT
jgi:hypothetical protein